MHFVSEFWNVTDIAVSYAIFKFPFIPSNLGTNRDIYWRTLSVSKTEYRCKLMYNYPTLSRDVISSFISTHVDSYLFQVVRQYYDQYTSHQEEAESKIYIHTWYNTVESA